MSPRIMWVPLVLLAVLVGFLLAVLIPRPADDPAGPTPTLIVTQTIPAREP